MKKYVEVVSRTDTGGNTRPMTVIWEDGRRYEIQSVLGAAQAANPIGGGMGMRFTCFINGGCLFLPFRLHERISQRVSTQKAWHCNSE